MPKKTNQKEVISTPKEIKSAHDLSFQVKLKESTRVEKLENKERIVEVIQDNPLTKIKNVWSEASAGVPILKLYTSDTELDGRTITIDSQKLINFGSCSYFGLEVDSRLKNASIEAIKKYGVQFSSTRAAVSIGLYKALEEKYLQIFGSKVIIFPTTTLAHLACIPIVVNKNDAVILDQQVHNSVQMTSQLLVANSIKVTITAHNELEILENKIKRLSKQYKKIWYFCDGIYSIYGDFAPIKNLQALQKKYPNLYLYIDDAHGFGWKGENGQGYALSNLENLERIIVATSNSKCFGVAGGTLIIKDKEMYENVNNFGATMIFSGPMQPPLLGASLASADIFLSKEITTLQDNLQSHINYRNILFEKYKLPIVKTSYSPISFIGVGDHKIVGKLFKILKLEGYFVNPALYPAVGLNKNGIRFTTTLHQTKNDIKNLLETTAFSLNKLLLDNGSSLNDIKARFKIIK